MNEKEQARQFSAFLDVWMHSPDAPPDAPDGMADLAAVAGDLFAVRTHLPAPPPAFEQRVWRQVRQVEKPARRAGLLGSLPELRLRWFAPVAAAILLVVLVLPGPRMALSNWMGSIQLGSVDVVVSPDPAVRPVLSDQHQLYDSLEAAAEATGLALAAPASLPSGYAPDRYEAVSFAELPVWMQPLFVESRFVSADDPSEYLLLRQYNASRSDQSQLGQVEFQSKDVDETRQLTMSDGTPAVLLVIGQSDPPLQELIWQQDGVTFELWSNALPVDDLQRVAESVNP
ncbi:MAG: hypothetical protein R2844_01590 [Caldilineales bacterium]